MMSSRRTAQLGLGAACLMLVTSITVLVAGSNDPMNKANSLSPQMSEPAHLQPLADGQLDSLQADLQPLASAKQ